MKTLFVSVHLPIASITIAALLAACGGSQPPIRALGPTAQTPAARSRASVSYGVLYSFQAGGSGEAYSPLAGLINVNGTLYGTTELGGDSGCSAQGCGTVFKITPSGTETVLHSFAGGSGDGAYPFAGLVNVHGTLYGTTFQGGANNIGTIFKITPSGTETALHSFGPYDSGDGAYPSSALLNINGTLYGTTERGSMYCEATCGTIFSITTSGAESVLYSFKGGSDGDGPPAGLINVGGTLYGTTYSGGTDADGTVFSITRSGTETVLYSFKGGSGDGAHPQAALINVNGTLYGTTNTGGVRCSGRGGCGTVFAITTSGLETVLYKFKGGSGDGAHPQAALININGTLYGTTANKGEEKLGTLFAIATSGTETVLHSFGGSGDGARPHAGLINFKGALYGTTYYGGANGWGTVFKLKPNPTYDSGDTADEELECRPICANQLHGCRNAGRVRRIAAADRRAGRDFAEPRDHSAHSASSVITGARKQPRWRLPGHTLSPRKWHTVRDDQARRRLL
ncbi:MAG: choice-of-anchor tandem repeat GloVer-containing protein [Candidatus Cybelea sp.]